MSRDGAVGRTPAGDTDDPLVRLSLTRRWGVDWKLDRMAGLLARCGVPQRFYPVVHVAGTNGKGSTAAMIGAAARRGGLRCGLFTSPHLCRFSERIQVDGEEISSAVLRRICDEVLRREPRLTFFEAATAIALWHFAEQHVGLAVVEAGLGGRLDATNVLDPLVSVITPIGLDHTSVLGADHRSIAAEKAGIIKPAGMVVASACRADVREVIEETAARRGARLWLEGRDFRGRVTRGGRLSYEGVKGQLHGLSLALRGDHQLQNATLALAALEALEERGVTVDPAARRGGLQEVHWPGRLEWLDARHLVDCAHNLEAARALAQALPADRAPFAVVFGSLVGKPAAAMLAELAPHSGRLVLTAPPTTRAFPPTELAAAVPGAEVAPDLSAALAALEGDPHPRLITGSCYLVGEARQLLAGDRGDRLDLSDPQQPGPGPRATPIPSPAAR